MDNSEEVSRPEPSSRIAAPCRCRICDGATARFGVGRVFGRIDAPFSRCQACFAVLADDPSWLDEAYTEAIAVQDIGLIARNVDLSRQVDLLLRSCFRQKDRFLDFGGGNGMFVRLMRDLGYDFRYFDAHAQNQFARGFEWQDEMPRPEVITALEVLEHLLHPAEELRPFTDGVSALVVSTVLVPDEAPPLDRWWYYSLQSGQHITIFNRRSLEALASRLGFKVSSVGTLHVLSRDIIPQRRLHAMLRLRATASRVFASRPSLLEQDFQLLFAENLDAP